jgi:hypothetical protein
VTTANGFRARWRPRLSSQKATGHVIDLQRIAVNHTGRLSEGGRDSEREGSSQGGQFHRSWLARDWGDTWCSVIPGFKELVIEPFGGPWPKM